jgi:hypothetical protein
MAQNGTAVRPLGSWITLNPWHVLAGSAVLAVLALVLKFIWQENDLFTPVRAILITASLIVALSAVSLRLQSASWQFDERVRSSAVVVCAALIGLGNYRAMNEDWDSLRLALRVFVVVGFAASLIILLSKVFQRTVISLLLLFHFAGILSAVTSVAPPGSYAPWISQTLWVRVFRPYLFFMYLTNAYHFYSPDPGPATLLWFYVKFEDGTGEWYRLADKNDFSTRQEYQRMLAITETTNYIIGQTPPENIWESKVLARRTAATFGKVAIPVSPSYMLNFQYREPNLQSKDTTSSYAKYVANHYHSEKNPELKVKSVKVYRVIHIIINADSLADGVDPWDPVQFLPYYHGEFDANGKMLDPKSPYLYWLLHTEATPKPGTPAKYLVPGKRPPAKYLDYTEYWQLHAQGTGPDPETK